MDSFVAALPPAESREGTLRAAEQGWLPWQAGQRRTHGFGVSPEGKPPLGVQDRAAGAQKPVERIDTSSGYVDFRAQNRHVGADMSNLGPKIDTSGAICRFLAPESTYHGPQVDGFDTWRPFMTGRDHPCPASSGQYAPLPPGSTSPSDTAKQAEAASPAKASGITFSS